MPCSAASWKMANPPFSGYLHTSIPILKAKILRPFVTHSVCGNKSPDTMQLGSGRLITQQLVLFVWTMSVSDSLGSRQDVLYKGCLSQFSAHEMPLILLQSC